MDKIWINLEKTLYSNFIHILSRFIENSKSKFYLDKRTWTALLYQPENFKMYRPCLACVTGPSKSKSIPKHVLCFKRDKYHISGHSFHIMIIFYFINWIVAAETIEGGKLFAEIRQIKDRIRLKSFIEPVMFCFSLGLLGLSSLINFFR